MEISHTTPTALRCGDYRLHYAFRIMTGLAGIMLIMTLTGCGSIRKNANLEDVQNTVRNRHGMDIVLPRTSLEQRDVDARIASLLARPFSDEIAVQVALLNNRRLRASLEELNISQADLLQASLLRNPSLSASSRFPSGGGMTNYEFGLAGDLFDWLLLPLRKKMALRDYEAAKRRVSHEVLDLAAEVKAAFYELQGRQQFLHKLEIATQVNEVTGDIAGRLHKAGNISALELLQEQTTASQAGLQLKRGRAELANAREKINRLLGLSGANTARWTFAENLPAIPSSDPALNKMETLALTQRQDLAAQKETLAAMTLALSLKKKTRLLPFLNLGVDTERDSGGSHVTGPTLGLELPVFDWGQASIPRAVAEVARAQATLEAMESDVRSDVRAAHNQLQSARVAYEHLAKTLLPQRQKILAESLLQYNAMQISNFVLLRAKEDEVAAEREAIEALRDYWIAHAQLEKAVGGSLTAKAAAKSFTSAPSTGDHDGHKH